MLEGPALLQLLLHFLLGELRMKLKTICIATLAAYGLVGAVYAQQQQDPQKIERVEVTGSAIKRIQAEGALPVQVITREEIERSGAQSATELIQKIPAMQGFVVNADSVNGGGGGVATAALRGLDPEYTLVLLNGRRLAPYTSGGAVNLQTIPLAAIERVEVLTDGASALYGSDAIAGVVNFILRKTSTEGAVDFTYNQPQESGGKSWNVGVSKGFGDFSNDGWNVLFAFSHDSQSELNASDRDFSKTGVRRIPGTNQALRLNSINSVPANVTLADADGNVLANFNPAIVNGGTCPALHIQAGLACRFDFSSTVQLIPKSERNSIFTSAKFKLGESTSIFGDLILSRYLNEPRYAAAAQPLPASFFPGGLDGPLFQQNIAPFLGSLGVSQADLDANNTTYNIRVFDAGGRQNRYTTDSLHLVGGVEGLLAGWDYNAGLTFSQNERTDKAIGGYLSANRFISAIGSGAYNPFGGAGTSVSALAPAVLNEVLGVTTTSIANLAVRGSRPLLKLDGGDMAVAVGFETTAQRYKDEPSPISQGANQLQPDFTDSIIGGGGGALPVNATRNLYGVFAELAAPISKSLELTGALRYDSVSAVTNDFTFDNGGTPLGSAKQGKNNSRATYKLSGRFQPTQQILLRGSYGTGFRSPNMLNISEALSSFGVTDGEYTCPFQPGDPLAAGCSGATTQYNQLRGGEASSDSNALRPEKSKQWTLGFRIEPTQAFSAGLDFWNIKLKDEISEVPEDVAFSDPVTYRDLFTLAPDPVSGQIRTNFILKPINLTKSEYSGIDLDVTGRFATGLGRMTLKALGTYFTKADYEIPGLPGVQTSLGKYGIDNAVVSRWLLNLSGTLDTANWAHTLSASFRPGYQDAESKGCPNPSTCSGPDVRNITSTDANGNPLTFGGRLNYTRRVSSYTTVDWQTSYRFNKQFELTGGIKNIFDEDPPFSIQDGGSGNMRGFDPRYSDPLGRQFYVKGSYKF
jgi:iron complex outermembrane recepter protein